MRGVIWILLAINLAVLGAGLTLPEQAIPRPSVPEWHPEKIQILGPAPFQIAVSCVRLSRFGPSQYASLRTWLEKEGLAASEITVSRTPGWWVYAPPGMKAEVSVQDLGIKSALRVKSGPFKGALALATFEREKTACGWRDELRGRGLAAVECGPRPLSMHAELSFPALDDATLERLRSVLPGVEVRRVECS